MKPIAQEYKLMLHRLFRVARLLLQAQQRTAVPESPEDWSEPADTARANQIAKDRPDD